MPLNTKHLYPNLLSYVKTHTETFEKVPFCEVDSLVFCSISYLYLKESFPRCTTKDGLCIKELVRAERFDQMFRYFDEMFDYFEELLGKDFDNEASRNLLLYMAASPRFRDVLVRFHVDELEKKDILQFSAMVFTYAPEKHYVAFRGTDWDITGWKEDMLFALPEATKAQTASCEYLNRLGKELLGTILVGGHSKGGNLAVYASSKCDKTMQNRIEVVFSHDGPGFPEAFLKDPGYLEMKDRIQKTTPHCSYVAPLLNSDKEPQIVESLGLGISEHYPFYWKVEDDHFALVKEQTLISKLANEKVSAFVDGLDNGEKRYLLETVFLLLDKMKINSVGDFDKKLSNNVSSILKTIHTLENPRRKFMNQMVTLFLFGTKTGAQGADLEFDKNANRLNLELKEFLENDFADEL